MVRGIKADITGDVRQEDFHSTRRRSPVGELSEIAYHAWPVHWHENTKFCHVLITC